MITENEVKGFESGLNSLDSTIRNNALSELNELSMIKKILHDEEQVAHNLHCHTFFSFNGYGFSPEYIAWLAARSGWFAAGIVDFDVLDGVDDFLAAAKKLNVRGVAGLESRVFVPEMSALEINSPGEPGIAYHMGVGFHTSMVPDALKSFAMEMRQKAAKRTAQIVAKVNAYLAPVILNFENEVLALTPQGNATERHVCTAFREKAEKTFRDPAQLAAFWSDKLNCSIEMAQQLLNNPVKLEGEIRTKTMKRGGVGYVEPDPSSFPTLAEMNKFVLGCGALPTVAWLNGLSGGENDVDALLDLHVANGAALLNIIPERNWNFAASAVQEKMVHELNRIIAGAQKRNMPIIIGTEMNAPGQKLVDDFEAQPLIPHINCFVDGAAIAYAHTVLSRVNKGYLSDWAKNNFKNNILKNRFYAAFGKKFKPHDLVKIDLNKISADMI